MGTVATVEQMREELRAGKRLRVVVGSGADDPVGILSLDGETVLWESVAGWSAGVVEPACFIGSDYLQHYLDDHESVEVIEANTQWR